jgi:hypothetical protein
MTTTPSARYQNFTAAIYARVYEVQQMQDLDWLRTRFEVMRQHVKVSKIYLETHRDMVVAEEATLLQARRYFADQGIQVAGGITVTVNERNRFQTYCYTNPEHRQKLTEVVEFTARLFDEVILDDFFFTNCKCSSCIQAKGEQSWTRFRLDLMTQAAQVLVIQPARAVNPNVKVVIKYPNWYEHFQALGFNLETEPAMFDGLYTGTETRDPVLGNQHLQQYLGYAIFRYFENLKPGGNGGGWVDSGGMRYLDRYAEQLWLTLFAKAPEVTLFDFLQLQRPILPIHRAPWQDSPASLAFDQTLAPYSLPDGTFSPPATLALAAGAAFDVVDPVLDQLGSPLGVACYKPYHSSGEDFLHNYLGMLGIPINLVPQFPNEAPLVLLTESARHDPAIVEKIKQRLLAGKPVVITSGLLRALQDRGLADIVELECTSNKTLVQQFLIGWAEVHSIDRPILIPQIHYFTNDSWEEISAIGGVTGYPIFHSAQYAASYLYVLTIPDNFSDLYRLPAAVLDRIRRTTTQGMYVHLEGPSQICLFVYDNDTWILHSFLDVPASVQVVVQERIALFTDIQSGEAFPTTAQKDWRGQPTGTAAASLTIPPHSFRVFRAA